ncbi:uncharacterized protein LAESUDRAFT_19736 [Laetiporus sulphureus 93-53]|uniref:HBS1-like protein N-terminal domain-containing protein n=1 Tax=Laetiporus sulphureus 93-53 TaxID=1314785 RepID=A0A165ICB1_9APHY|nr:uncharacterized protein LAESUDRAFT_19736 [Laetiporus sulphureus 93-53]KZT12883.1 hypothetical protein LAESUDRAFT_19736 [Laetiporus sulphureus 93-53]
MSRHRYVRNIDINEELEEDVLSDGGEEELFPEEYEQLMRGLEQVRVTLGSEEQSDISDEDIKDALSYYNYDVHQSVNWLLEEQEKRKAARERKGEKSLPPPPEAYEDAGADMRTVYPGLPSSASGRSNIPLIRLAPSQPQEEFEYSDYTPSESPRRQLSTITERTEQSTDTGSLTPRAREPISLPRTPSVASTSDYGEVIVRPDQDTNLVPSSSSAARPLSNVVPAISMSSSESRTATPTTMSPVSTFSAPVPSLSSIPDIPSLHTKKSTIRPGSEKKSKLSALAGSRSSARSAGSSVISASEASRSHTPSEEESLATFPSLRPTSASLMSKRYDDQSSISGTSSMSMHVRRAVQTALDLEAPDRIASSSESRSHHHHHASLSQDPSESATAQPLPEPQPQRSPPQAMISSPPTRTAVPIPESSAAQLHHRRSHLPTPPATEQAATVPPQEIAPDSNLPVSEVIRLPALSEATARQSSKLAKLAQAKAQQGPWMPKPRKSSAEQFNPLQLRGSHTKYMMPIANGPTATTAITTSYQTLASLATAARSELPPSILPSGRVGDFLAPRVDHGGVETKTSKLAMKSRKAHQKHEPEPAIDKPQPTPSELPLFSPKGTRTHKSSTRHGRTEKGREERSRSSERQAAGYSTRTRTGSLSHRERRETALSSVAELSPLAGFAFDIPSPDDIVSNARRGTSLAARSGSGPSSGSHSAPSGRSARGHSAVDAVAS